MCGWQGLYGCPEVEDKMRILAASLQLILWEWSLAAEKEALKLSKGSCSLATAPIWILVHYHFPDTLPGWATHRWLGM
jgi:hypothetical protein